MTDSHLFYDSYCLRGARTHRHDLLNLVAEVFRSLRQSEMGSANSVYDPREGSLLWSGWFMLQ